MSEVATVCAYCREAIEGRPVVRMGKTYCSEACAFEGTERPKPKQCGVPVRDSTTLA
jgi:hypothetical protein